MRTQLILGDCNAEMAKLDDESFDACVTSPPYNLDIKYNTYDDDKPENAYLEWVVRWSLELHRLLKPNGSFFLNIAGSHVHPWLPHEIVCKLRRYYYLQNTFHWIKAISINENSSHGHFKPINSDRFVTSCHEYVFQFSMNGTSKLDRLALGVQYADKSNIKRWKHTKGKDKRCRGNTWFVPYQTIQKFEDRPHPATFPVQLAEFCIKISKAKSVIDPFVGLGNTGMAAKNCGVEDFIGIDIDKIYLDQARENLVL